MKKEIKYIMIALLMIPAIFIAGLSQSYEESYSPRYFYSGDTLNIALKVSSKYSSELLDRFSKQERCIINSSTDTDTLLWKKLISGNIDAIILNSEEEIIPDDYQTAVVAGVSIDDKNSVWVVSRNNLPLLQRLDYWFNFFRKSDEYRKLRNRYRENFTTVYQKNGINASLVSSFDSLIQKYAKEIGWDWRLVSSLIYQESRFNSGIKSRHGAIGLMQVKPSSAKQFGITNLYDPEQNIKAGTLLIKKLQDMYKRAGLDPINQIKFTLAAYNAGHGRVKEIMEFADKHDIDPNDWDQVKEVIPMMNNFGGRETIQFVDIVLSRYNQKRQSI